jgi:hypothetical protein
MISDWQFFMLVASAIVLALAVVLLFFKPKPKK